ncbi:MAG TPA: hypothetical protein VG826_36115 [Pirellulales bacterium]|nr:hypothetical protein [Pirellulales bacterium]
MTRFLALADDAHTIATHARSEPSQSQPSQPAGSALSPPSAFCILIDDTSAVGGLSKCSLFSLATVIPQGASMQTPVRFSLGPPLLALLLWSLSGPAVASADEEKSVPIEEWHRLYKQRAVAAKAREDTDPPKELNIVSEAVQAFANPVRPGSQHGFVYVWTDEGRPRIIGAVWSALDPVDTTRRSLCYEFHSLSEHPLTVQLDQCNVRWTPREGYADWQQLQPASAPSEKRLARLTQMRRIAQEVQVENDTDESELRLLTQPVYRYPEDVGGALDGAIFSFVMGTDPEFFLWIEAREAKDGSRSWWIAPIRFTGTGLVLKHNGRVLWESPAWESFSRDKLYDFLYGVERFSNADAMPIGR